MTDPASAISRQIDRLIQMQIITLGKPSSLTQLELREYHSRSAKLKRLLADLNWRQPVRPYSMCEVVPRLRTAI